METKKVDVEIELCVDALEGSEMSLALGRVVSLYDDQCIEMTYPLQEGWNRYSEATDQEDFSCFLANG